MQYISLSILSHNVSWLSWRIDFHERRFNQFDTERPSFGEDKQIPAMKRVCETLWRKGLPDIIRSSSLASFVFVVIVLVFVTCVSYAGVHNCCVDITSILTVDRKFSRLIPLSFPVDIAIVTEYKRERWKAEARSRGLDGVRFWGIAARIFWNSAGK